jgi:hypothetical protein
MAAESEEAPRFLRFHYIKGPGYREFSCHGAIGAPTPQGDAICMSLYMERQAIPRMIEYEGKGSGDRISLEELSPTFIDRRDGVIRHIEASVYMNLDVARKLHSWLEQQIEILQKREQSQ